MHRSEDDAHKISFTAVDLLTPMSQCAVGCDRVAMPAPEIKVDNRSFFAPEMLTKPLRKFAANRCGWIASRRFFDLKT